MNPWIRKLIKYSKISSCWYNFENDKYGYMLLIFQYFRLFYLFISAAICSYFLITADLSYGIGRGVFLCPICVFIFTKTFLIMIKQNALNQLIERLNTLLDSYKEEKEIGLINHYLELAWKILLYCSMFSGSFTIIYFPVRITLDATLLLTNMITAPSLLAPLPFGGFLKGKYEPAFFYTIEILSTIWGVWGMIAFVGVDGLFCICTVSMFILKKLLKNKILSLKSSSKRLTAAEASRQLTELAKEHATMIQLLDNSREVFGLAYAFQNVFLALPLCFSAYASVKVKSLVLYLCFKLSTVIIFGATFLSCFMGEILKMENENLFNALYDLPWYNQNLAFRRTLLMMLRQAKKPFTIGYKNQPHLEMDTFGTIMQITYKLLTVFGTVMGEI